MPDAIAAIFSFNSTTASTFVKLYKEKLTDNISERKERKADAYQVISTAALKLSEEKHKR